LTLAEYSEPTDSYKDAVRNLALEYAEQKRRGDVEWITLRHPRDGEMQYELFHYFPEAHFRKAYDQLQAEYRSVLRTDGGYSDLHNGKRKATVYYWYDPDTGAALEHTGLNDEKTVPFFPDEETAHDYLEKRAEAGGKERYEGLSLYKARTRKVGDAVDVLTDQSGIEDFVPDGGRLEDPHQIPNPAPDTVWFWYNPSVDSIVQEETEPYDVRGVFASEDDAYRFLDWYANQYGVDHTSHLELYSAEIELEGYGWKHVVDEDDEEALPEQADFDAFRTSSSQGGSNQ
jgi:hypothetical protein